MAKYALLMGFILMAGPGFTDTPQTFVPSRDTGVPTYLNAEVLRVDREAGTVTLRSESGDVVLTVDRDRVPGLIGLRPGDKVFAAYRTVIDSDGHPVRMVMSVRPTSPSSGEPGVVLAAASTSRNVRVLGTNRTARTVTVVDDSGVSEVLSVQASAKGFRTLRAGDTVALSLAPGVGVAGGQTMFVTGFEPIPAGLVADATVVPSVSGQLVRFDRTGGTVTMSTVSGERTFPVGSTGISALSTFRPGDNISLDFSTTTGANQLRGAAPPARGAATPMSTVSRTELVSGSLAARGGTVTTFGSGVVPVGLGGPTTVGGVSAPTPIAGVSASPQAVGVSGVSNATSVAGAPGSSITGQTGSTAAAGGMTGIPFASTNPGVPGFVIATAAGPLTNPVPSVPAPTPTMTVVLPPAVAKAPNSAEEVGLMRLQGERDFDLAAMTLALAANEIDIAWARFKNVCLDGFLPESSPGREWFLLRDGRVPTPTDDSCRVMHAELQGRVQGFDAQLDIALEAARRADVLPGRIRETLERYRMQR